MAAAASTTYAFSSPALLGGSLVSRRQAVAELHFARLPCLPPPPMSSAKKTLALRNATKSHRIAPRIFAMSTGETPAEVGSDLPESVTALQDAWNKLDDKYAVASLAFALVVALWCSTGMISAIDRLPVLPGVLELVGIGYTGWFAYQNLIFKPDREALIAKIKNTYDDVLGNN